MDDIILSAQNLSKHFVIKRSIFSPKTVIKAVDDISFEIKRGETLGLIGESGSGKTTASALVMKLEKLDSGRIVYDGEDITDLSFKEMRGLRKDMQIIFQHSQGTLDPKMNIEELIIEPLRLHNVVSSGEYESEVKRLLNLVGISEREKHKFTDQVSGGQRQRVGIARAIATKPSFIVCDEPVSALDISVQGQIINLLLDLKKELSLTYLFISHDLKVIKHVCDKIAVMHYGKIVETGHRDEVLKNPKDDYTKQLLESML
jgi:ABC-type oligopeptide transport system ATPase subunit